MLTLLVVLTASLFVAVFILAMRREMRAFYERCGLAPVPTLMGRECDEWQPLDTRTIDAAELGGRDP